jgi:uncharacterized membrane protein YdbT with pleckstrin-like domain
MAARTRGPDKGFEARAACQGVVGPRDVDYLQPGEESVLTARRHMLSAVDTFLGLTFLWLAVTGGLVAVALLGPEVARDAAWTVTALVAVAHVIAMTATHWRRATSLYVVTRERVYGAHGRMRFQLTQTTYDKVTDLHLRQSVFGRLWGYGTVIVQTAGTGLALIGVSDPVAFKQAIEEQREAFIARLVRKAPARATGNAQRDADMRPDAARRVVWEGRPAPASLVGGFTVAIVFLVVGIAVLGVGLATGTPAVWGGAVGIAIAIVTAWGQWIEYRYSRFEVSTRGVALQKGWLSRRRVEATYSKVTDVTVAQDILGRILGYGRIVINTAGSNEAPVVFAGVAQPSQVKAVVDDARAEADA